MLNWSASLLLSLSLAFSSISEAQAPPGASASPVPRNLEEYSAFSALWRTDQSFRSTVHISNQLATTEIDAVLTIYMADGTPWELPTVHLAKSGVTDVDLNAAIANAPQKVQSHLSSYGSARLRYRYAWQGAVLANISILDEVRSLEYMSPFVFPPNQGKGETLPAKVRELRDSANGTTYEGLWFRAGHNGGGFVGLANTTDSPLSVHLAMSGLRSNPLRDVTLQGHGAALVDLADMFVLDETRAGGITVSHSGPSGALQIVGGLEDLTTGFSTNLPLMPIPTRAREVADRQFGSAGMMVNEQNSHLGFPPGLRFSPYAFFRNIASEVRTLHMSAWYQVGNIAKQLSLPDLVIQPGQARELDIHDILKSDPQVSDLNLLYEYTGDYADILAATGSTDGTGNYVFPVLPEPIAPSGAKNSAYWEAQGGFDTMYTIWNPTDSPEDVIVLVRYGAGAKYRLPIHLEEYASAMVDIGELIRTQQPDQDGNIIPPQDAHEGSLLVSPATGEPVDLMTAVISAGIYNPRKGTCGIGCVTCSGLAQTQMSPSSFIMVAGNSDIGYYTYWLCDGNATLISSQSHWSTSNSSIATVQTAGQSNPGLTTGVSPGSTNIAAAFGPAPACIPQYCSPPPQSCPQYVFGSGAPVTVTPQVTFGPLSAVTVGGSVPVLVSFSGGATTSPMPITLSISTTSGTGSAVFASGASTMTITAPTLVTVTGVAASSSQNNLVLDATIAASEGSGTQEDATNPQSFSVITTAIPVNFTTYSENNLSDGTMQFSYSWQSSSGNLNDISSCIVGENVSYRGSSPTYQWPAPMVGSSVNPTILNVQGNNSGPNGTTAGMGDYQYAPSSYTKPYEQDLFQATQMFQWACPSYNGGAFYRFTPNITITRSVIQNPSGQWIYQVTKSGFTSTYTNSALLP